MARANNYCWPTAYNDTSLVCLLLGLSASQLVTLNLSLIFKDLNLFCHAYLARTRNNLFMDLLIVFLFCVHERNYVSGVKGFDSLLESIPSLCTRPCCLYNKCLSFHFISTIEKSRCGQSWFPLPFRWCKYVKQHWWAWQLLMFCLV